MKRLPSPKILRAVDYSLIALFLSRTRLCPNGSLKSSPAPSADFVFTDVIAKKYSHASLREWVSWLTSQSSSPGSARGGGGGGGGLGGKDSQELLETHPYRGVFIGCEGLEAAEAQSLCEGLGKAVFTRLVQEE